ncbi:MAG: hypothetical protein ACLSCV_00415 [Acutalibacteraceae bacterium]
MNYIKFSKFEDLDDFRDSLLRGREIVFEYNGKEYGIFLLTTAFMSLSLNIMKQKKYIKHRTKRWNTLLTASKSKISSLL